jgi:predicted CXXCH cytochrome family protein
VFRHAKETIHKPFEQQQCLGCHAPHGGASRAMLAADTVEELCTLCHSKEEEGIVHPPYAEGNCVGCHVSHQSDHKALLRADEPTLCMGCHEDVKDQLARATVVHKPVTEGCQECHRGHASPHANLLTKAYPGSFYAPFDESAYELCFECHAEALFTKAESSLTSFRNGTANLHYLHVHQGEKGRTCRACHESHGSTFPKLVRDEVSFGPGGWKLPVSWKPTRTGGTCATGCHRALSYDRETAVSY